MAKKLGPHARMLLGWLSRSEAGLLESQIVGSGRSSALNELLVNGYADLTDLGVKERSGIPAAAYTITDRGRELVHGANA